MVQFMEKMIPEFVFDEYGGIGPDSGEEAPGILPGVGRKIVYIIGTGIVFSDFIA